MTHVSPTSESNDIGRMPHIEPASSRRAGQNPPTAVLPKLAVHLFLSDQATSLKIKTKEGKE